MASPRDLEAAREYQRAYRRGVRRPRLVRPAAVRLLEKTDRLYGQRNGPELGDCWEFSGARNSSGYGVLSIGDRLVLAHRLALSLALGRPIAPGMFANHRCDNRPCVRPRHLYEGTPEENVADAIERGTFRGFTPSDADPQPDVLLRRRWGAA